MANRQWRVTGSFHKIAEVAVIVISPNWQGALRKGALAIKHSPELKGRRLNKGVFTVNEQETVVEAITGEQASLPVTISPEGDAVNSATGQIIAHRKCSNPNCNQPFAHEGMCDNAPKEEDNNVDGSQVAETTTGNTNQEG